MKFSSFAFFAALVASVAAAPSSSHKIHERRSDAPKKWMKRDRVSSKAVLPMRIGLTQSNLHRGDDLLMEM